MYLLNTKKMNGLFWFGVQKSYTDVSCLHDNKIEQSELINYILTFTDKPSKSIGFQAIILRNVFDCKVYTENTYTLTIENMYLTK